MSHILTLNGRLTKDSIVKTVETKDGKRKVLEFTVASDAITLKETKFYDVTFWYKKDDEIKQAQYLKKGMLVSLAGEEYAIPYQNKEGELKVNYKFSGLRGTLQFLIASKKE